MDKLVFLGGTCNGSRWRDGMINLLDRRGISYFNPVVEDWNEDCKRIELEMREKCTHCLYVITPKMVGTYSIAEVVDDSNKRPKKTVFVAWKYDEEREFNNSQWFSLASVKRLVRENGARVYDSLTEAAISINLR